jgi:hypothetical protein
MSGPSDPMGMFTSPPRTRTTPKQLGIKVFDRDGTFKRFIPGYVGANGIRFIKPDGTIVSGDVTYAGPLGIHQFTEFADVSIGQGPEVGAVVLVKDASGKYESKLRWLYQVPYLVQFIRANLAGGTYYIHVPDEIRREAVPFALTLEQLKQLPFVEVAPQNPPQKPPPTQPEEPKPVNYRLSDAAKAVIRDFVAQFPVPQATQPGDLVRPGAASEQFENKARVWTRQLAEQLKFSVPAEDWGTKNAGGGRPQSKDSISRIISKRLINFDVMTGVGTGSPRLVGDPQGADITGQTFMSVEPVNHLGAPPPVDPPPVVSPSDDTRVLIAALRAEIEALKLRIATLEAKPAVTLPDDVVRRGAPVEVSGKFSLVNVYRGETVTWSGKVK